MLALNRLGMQRILIAGGVVIPIVVVVVYFAGLRMNFIYDDWKNLETLGRLGTGKFIERSFDPTTPSFLTAYRPFQGLLLGLEFATFGKNPFGYHAVHIILHLVNCLLIYLIVKAILGNFRLAFLAGLFYATFPTYNLSIFLPSAPDVLATFFYLLAILFWVIYLQNKWHWSFVLTHVCFVFGLLSKEIVVSLPIMLFLIDYFLVDGSHQVVVLSRRYSLIICILFAYVIFEFNILSRTFLYYAYGMRIGTHILSNLMNYMSGLVIPWSANTQYLWILLLGVMLLYLFTIRVQRPLLAFLGIWSILNILPVLGLQAKFSPRYLYLSSVASAIFWALVIDGSWRALKQYRYSTMIISSVVVLLLFSGATAVNYAVHEIADETRAQRAPFRDIAQQHPSFPKDTYLYFIDPPAHINELSGMLYERYGDAVTVGGINPERANLWKYANPLIYYFDLTGKPIEVAVRKNRTATVPEVPVNFNNLIVLEGYELSNTLEPGHQIVLFLYWRAQQKIADDFTVFVHVVCSKEMAAGEDSQPVRGKNPTSSWIPGTMVVDAVILSIPKDLESRSDCHLETGLYYLPTMQRLPIVDEFGVFVSDHIKIEYLAIQE